MRSTSLFSIFGFALCVGAAVVACGGGDDDTAAPTKLGDVGQSCTRTGDCSGSLVCIDNTCQKKGTVGAGGEGTGGSTGGTSTTGGTGGSNGGKGGTGTGGSAGKGGSGAAGSGTGGTTTTPPPVLSGPGESCSKTADCEDKLKCFNQRCVASDMTGAGGEAGGGSNPPPPGPSLGQLGETCTLTSDCAAGLSCMPGGYLAPGVGFVGICTQANSGITPTGKECTTECRTATDCCELPPTILSAYAIKSCADLEDLLSGVDCTDPGAFADECFVRSSYCKCGTNTWKCTEGQCLFNAACSTAGLDTEGCATYSRSDRPLVSTCNDGKCQAATVDPLCTSSADCEGLTVAEGGDTCTANECTCYKATGFCYRKCSNDLDCAFGQHCDTKTTVCFDDPECDSDLICQRKTGNVNAICDADGVCQTACHNDIDCNGGVLTTSFSAVCVAGVCTDIGCSQDSECEAESGVKMFCDTPPATGATGDVPHSALTDGK